MGGQGDRDEAAMKLAVFTAIFVSLTVPAFAQSEAQWSSQLEPFRSGYVLSGYLLRAGSVCGHVEQFVDASLAVIARIPATPTPQAAVNVMHRWTLDGDNNFNRQVSQVGVAAACTVAERERRGVYGR